MTSVEKIIAELRELAGQLRDLSIARDELANVRAEVALVTGRLKAVAEEFARKSAEKEAALKRLDAGIVEYNKKLNAIRAQIYNPRPQERTDRAAEPTRSVNQ